MCGSRTRFPDAAVPTRARALRCVPAWGEARRRRSGLLLDARERCNVGEPGLSGTEPDLASRGKIGSLSQSARPDVDPARVAVRVAGPELGPAGRAEGHRAPVAALGGLHVGLRLARHHPEGARGRDHDGAKGGPRHRLAVGAVTDAGGLGVGLRLEVDLSAVAGAIDLHGQGSRG